MRLKKIFMAVSLSFIFSGFGAICMEYKLSEKEQNITLIAANTALGDMEQLKIVLRKALDSRTLTTNEIKEILVQMYAYCGFPRSLNAINKFKELIDEREASGIKDKVGDEGKTLPINIDKNKYGEEVRAKLTKTRKAGSYAQFVPVIDDYLKEHLFADIFARGVLSEQEREIATIAALASRDGVEAQRNAHINVGKNTGLSEEQVDDILAISDVQKNFRIALKDPVFEIGEKNDAFAKYFKGQSYLKMLAEGIANVTFEPGCRNNWHIHHGKKQILLVTGGRGYYQEFGKPAQELHKGDVVSIPPDTKHWHGAACDSWFSHISVEVSTSENGSTEWCEEVGDEDYNKLK